MDWVFFWFVILKLFLFLIILISNKVIINIIKNIIFILILKIIRKIVDIIDDINLLMIKFKSVGVLVFICWRLDVIDIVMLFKLFFLKKFIGIWWRWFFIDIFFLVVM